MKWAQLSIRSQLRAAPAVRDDAGAKAIHSALMARFRSFWTICVLGACALLSPEFANAGKKHLPSVRWTAGTPGCTCERRDDGKYSWTMTGKDLTVTLMMDSQELTKSRHRYFHPVSAFVSVTYIGQDKFEFPADVRIDFVRHHDVVEAYMDPTEFSTKLQNDIDSEVFKSEREIKKDPKLANEKTARLRIHEKEASEFIEFLSTQTLEPNTVMLGPGNPEAHGWVFFATTNKWIGPLKSHEDFVISLWMKDKIWQFPVSLPPAGGDLILRKPPEQ
jgi:hypothetical protein